MPLNFKLSRTKNERGSFRSKKYYFGERKWRLQLLKLKN